MGAHDHLLLDLEKGFPDWYREYYAVKRNNFFAGVTNYPELWHCFILLDGIFARELEDIRVISDLNKLLPFMLFTNAHAQFRVFLELGFAGSFVEAFNVARIAIESCYQACRLNRDPKAGARLVSARPRKSRRQSVSKGAANSRAELAVHARISGICGQILNRDGLLGGEPWSLRMSAVLRVHFAFASLLRRSPARRR